MVVTTTSTKGLPRMGLGMAALGRPGYINLDRDSTFGSSSVRDVKKMQEQAIKSWKAYLKSVPNGG